MNDILSEIDAARKQLASVESVIEAIEEEPLNRVGRESSSLIADFQRVQDALNQKLGKVLETLTPLALYLKLGTRVKKVPFMFKIFAAPPSSQRYLIGQNIRLNTGAEVVKHLGMKNAMTLCRTLSQGITVAISEKTQETEDFAKSKGDEMESLKRDVLQLAESIRSQLTK